MAFPNPRPIRKLPTFNESSVQRSPRDYDATPRLWQKINQDNAQISNLCQNVEQVQRQLDRLRKRVGASADLDEIEIVDCATGNTYAVAGRLVSTGGE